jgi:hypothetical protein
MAEGGDRFGVSSAEGTHDHHRRTARAQRGRRGARVCTLVDELASAGIQGSIVSEANGAAEANLTVGSWQPGSQGLRWLIGFGAGKGEIVVSVDTATIGIEGSVHGWVTGGLFGGDDENSARAAGHLIGRTIVSGRNGPAPGQSPKTPHSMASVTQ